MINKTFPHSLCQQKKNTERTEPKEALLKNQDLHFKFKRPLNNEEFLYLVRKCETADAMWASEASLKEAEHSYNYLSRKGEH